MKNTHVNGNNQEVRKLSPYPYPYPIKTLDKSNETRVVLDGVRCFRSAVTRGRDVGRPGSTRQYVYFWMLEEDAKADDRSKRGFMEITLGEFNDYRAGKDLVINVIPEPVVAPEPVVVAPEPVATPADVPEPALPATPDVPAELEAPVAEKPAKTKFRKAARPVAA